MDKRRDATNRVAGIGSRQQRLDKAKAGLSFDLGQSLVCSFEEVTHSKGSVDLVPDLLRPSDLFTTWYSGA